MYMFKMIVCVTAEILKDSNKPLQTEAAAVFSFPGGLPLFPLPLPLFPLPVLNISFPLLGGLRTFTGL